MTESFTKPTPPRVIVIDLTPILSGGENGGARIFVLELLAQLAEIAPATQFILLTQAASHDQLAELDRPNMRRRLVVGPVVGNALRPRLIALAGWLLPRLPAWPGQVISHLGYTVNSGLKRAGSARLMHELEADLLFCPFSAPTYWEPGLPTICTLYDLQYSHYPEFFAPEDRAHRERVFVDACRRASRLVAISDDTRLTAIQSGCLDPDRIRTIHLRLAQRLDPELAHTSRILERLGLELGSYLLYPANFWQHKNHERLLQAFAMAGSIGLPASIKLVCTGAPGPRLEFLRAHADSLRLGGRVLFPGYVSDADLAALMRQAVGLIFPSLYEGFGLPLIEAMAFARPVACSRIGALPEVAGEAALLFDPTATTEIAQAMIDLVCDPTQRDRLVQAGRARAQEFSDARRMALDYWTIFCEVLERPDA